MQRLLTREIVPFGVLFGIAVALLEVHRFAAALFVFAVGCAILTVRLLLAAFMATGALKWLLALLVCVAAVVGEQYLVGVVVEAQEERWQQLLAGLPKPDNKKGQVTDPVAAQILDELRKMQQSGKTSSINKLSLVVGSALEGINIDGGAFWLVRDSLFGKVATPAQLAVSIGVINNTSAATMITAYYAEMKDRSGKWVTLKALETSASMMYVGIDPQKVRRIREDTEFFDRSIWKRTLQRGDTALGWALFEYPESLQVAPLPRRIRITVEEANGGTQSQIIGGEVKHGGNEVGQGAEIGMQPGVVNLTQYRLLSHGKISEFRRQSVP